MSRSSRVQQPGANVRFRRDPTIRRRGQGWLIRVDLSRPISLSERPESALSCQCRGSQGSRRPVSDVARSTRFYTEVVGCRHLSTTPNGQMVFLDAAGLCLILVKRNPPINTVPDNHSGVHHAFAVAHDEYAAALKQAKMRDGGNAPAAAYYEAQLPKARSLLDRLASRNH